MKSVIISITLVIFSITAQAGEYTFKYMLKGESLQIKMQGKDQEEAFDRAAQQCWKHYIKKQKFTSDYGLDVIDICANPR